jgi:FAD/FMN-containing dehydrogenase
MTTDSKIHADLSALLGADNVQAIDRPAARHHHPRLVCAWPQDVGVHALVLPRTTEHVSKALRYCR